MELTNLRYSKDHEWVAVDGDIATVGITTYAAQALGDVVYVDLPEVGTEVEANSVVGEVESTKSVSDLFCPVPGSVTETNEEIVDSPELVNSDPFGAAWLFKVKVTEIPDDLLDKAAYDELTKEA